MINHFSHF